jgi:hypothetical protein
VSTGIYSTVTFGPHGEVFVWHEIVPVVDLALQPSVPVIWPPTPTPPPREEPM